MRIINLTCAECAKSFETKLSQYEYNLRRNPNYKPRCSRDCIEKSQLLYHWLKCDFCKQSFKKINSEYIKTNHHFCSKSCSAKFFNAPRKKVKIKLPSKRGINLKQRKTRIGTMTKGQYKDSCRNNHNFQSSTRIHARRVYLQSSTSKKECIICGYTLHYHVSHIKPVASFDNNAFMIIVNDINNLVALCPTHHWEYDNGHLKLNNS